MQIRARLNLNSVLPYLLWVALLAFASVSHAQGMYTYHDSPKCELKVFRNSSWQSIAGVSIPEGHSFAVLHSPKNPEVGLFTIDHQYFSANNDCLIPVVSKALSNQSESEEAPLQKKSPRKTDFPRSFSIGALSAKQSFSLSSTDGNKYALVGTLKGVTMAFRYGSRLLKFAIEPYVGLITVIENDSATPTPPFVYNAANYLDLGSNVYFQIEPELGNYIELGVKLGGGANFVSLPAPSSVNYYTYSAPASFSFYFSAQVDFAVFIVPKFGIYLNVGMNQSTANLSEQLGLRWRYD